MATIGTLIMAAALTGTTCPVSARERGEDFAGYRGAPPVVIRMRRTSIPRPRAFEEPSQVVTERRSIEPPRAFKGGRPITQPAAVAPPGHHAAVAGNPAVLSSIQEQQRTETVPGRFYWHRQQGVRWAHYYDDHQVHWYGFYHGPDFYWCRYHAGYWWWWDVRFERWVYWRDGYWWWPGPGGIVYVYVDNAYYPYEDGAVMVKQPVVQTPPASAPSAGAGPSWDSPDGRRMVQLVEPRGEAFLYDRSGGQPVFMKYLGSGVEKVRFSGGSGGKPVEILTDLKDGGFALFDEDGGPLDRPPSPAAPPPPQSIPPQ